MSYFKSVSDTFWRYISPRKTVKRRDKPFKAPVASQRNFSVESSPNPQLKVQQWDVRTPSPRASGDGDVTMLPPSPPQSLERTYTDFEGDTLIDGMVEKLNTKEGRQDYDVYDANDETLVVDEGRYLEERKETRNEIERDRQKSKAKELRAQGWPEDAIFLFTKLAMRGFEPLFPFSWINDFTSFPLDLFTRSKDKAYIKAMTDDWRGTLDLTLNCLAHLTVHSPESTG
jgi:hypothetical protein